MEVFAITIHRIAERALDRARAAGLRRDEGQTFVEYALILAFIATAMTGVLLVFQGKLLTIYSVITTAVDAALP
jgi:Flp pilus assembly pilin Flp